MATGIPVTGGGIALGPRSLAVIQTTFALVPGSYIWLHEYRGPAPMPEHQDLAGRSFNGDYVLVDGVNFYPGDHAGCQCAALPEWKEVGA